MDHIFLSLIAISMLLSTPSWSNENSKKLKESVSAKLFEQYSLEVIGKSVNLPQDALCFVVQTPQSPLTTFWNPTFKQQVDITLFNCFDKAENNYTLYFYTKTYVPKFGELSFISSLHSPGKKQEDGRITIRGLLTPSKECAFSREISMNIDAYIDDLGDNFMLLTVAQPGHPIENLRGSNSAVDLANNFEGTIDNLNKSMFVCPEFFFF